MITSTIKKSGEKITVKSHASESCTFNKQGFPFCSCNDCIEAITDYAEFNKKDVYWYKGRKVKIQSFCPLEHCCDIFLVEIPKSGFCKWLTLSDARKTLQKTETLLKTLKELEEKR